MIVRTMKKKEFHAAAYNERGEVRGNGRAARPAATLPPGECMPPVNGSTAYCWYGPRMQKLSSERLLVSNGRGCSVMLPRAWVHEFDDPDPLQNGIPLSIFATMLFYYI
jgi:hypothetical protein